MPRWRAGAMANVVIIAISGPCEHRVIDRPTCAPNRDSNVIYCLHPPLCRVILLESNNVLRYDPRKRQRWVRKDNKLLSLHAPDGVPYGGRSYGRGPCGPARRGRRVTLRVNCTRRKIVHIRCRVSDDVRAGCPATVTRGERIYKPGGAADAFSCAQPILCYDRKIRPR
ncbi:hypothetical protein EVAR_29519_1 [Eumeta japonica]|uniref:Uncharacterized protein n=1 Tax=Eumeta variegata TaxID=151549 RepID=A0A4C1WER6_EUMVA|nr:hypothetical protein EVAR_29519_1 [Eumeta japonica]